MDFVFYHGNCNDGAGAALAAWLLLGEHEARYIPVQYGKPVPWSAQSPVALTLDELRGARVFVLDFAWGWPDLLTLAAEAAEVHVLDHHKSAAKTLLGEPRPPGGELVKLDIDQDKSGAVLAWGHFHHGSSLPRLFTRLQDRDLWQHRYSATDDVHYGLLARPDWRTWDVLLEGHPAAREEWSALVAEGQAIRAFLAAQIEAPVRHVLDDPKRRVQNFCGHQVPVLNVAPFLASDVLNQILQGAPELPFAASYFDMSSGDGAIERVYQLRSHPAGADVETIAQRQGGGGHRNAAGFRVTCNGSFPLP